MQDADTVAGSFTADMDLYKCAICSASSSTHNLLRAHHFHAHQFLASLHSYCPICLEFPETIGLTLVHQRASKHNRCCVCFERFGRFDLLLSHFIEKHMTERTMDMEKHLHCTECCTVHSTTEALLQHMHSSHLNVWRGLFEIVASNVLASLTSHSCVSSYAL
uniref:Zinc finger C2H2 n=1 Tax=Echinococcus granulosus TaxID=6210 RepID=A0A068WSB5_ECHGR|nr:Zinc finger C2H2 [Echinococcus granulosus]